MYDGTGGDEDVIVQNFMQVYERYILQGVQGPDLGDVTAEMWGTHGRQAAIPRRDQTGGNPPRQVAGSHLQPGGAVVWMAQGPAVRKECVHFQGGGAEHQGPAEVPGNHGAPGVPPSVVNDEVPSLFGLGSNVGGRGTVLRMQGQRRPGGLVDDKHRNGEYDRAEGNSTAVSFFRHGQVLRHDSQEASL